MANRQWEFEKRSNPSSTTMSDPSNRISWDSSKGKNKETSVHYVENPTRPIAASVPPDDHITPFPNTWCRYRAIIREAVAEFLGTCILVVFGAGVNCQVALSTNPGVASSPKGDYLSSCFGWAVGISLGVWVSGGISGGHINPALLGGIMGAAFVYWTYIHAINIYEGGNNLDYLTAVSCFFAEFFATAILLIVIFAINDKYNCPPPSGLAPLVLFITLLGISASLGMQTSFAVNPARDLGPRLLTSMVGYGKAVYTFRNQYWIWCPIMADFLGGLAGAGFYDLFLYTGEESIFNRPNAESRRQHLHAHAAQRDNLPSGANAV
ncbi:hypothetical protein H0H93_002515 [Arthromyces matolae]|nr:hypothetical protein H0H93_002515 [Arthromyces matolae]